VAGVEDLIQRIDDGHTGRVLDVQIIRRSGDAVYDLYCACGDEKYEFLDRASKPRSAVYQ
jgi:hypothetical protein